MSTIKTIADKNFEEIISNGLVIIDFWAPWCGPCKMMLPILEDVSKDYNNIIIGKVNIDENPEVTSKYNITNIPTILFFKNGIAIDQHSGIITKQKLKSMIDKFIN